MYCYRLDAFRMERTSASSDPRCRQCPHCRHVTSSMTTVHFEHSYGSPRHWQGEYRSLFCPAYWLFQASPATAFKTYFVILLIRLSIRPLNGTRCYGKCHRLCRCAMLSRLAQSNEMCKSRNSKWEVLHLQRYIYLYGSPRVTSIRIMRSANKVSCHGNAEWVKLNYSRTKWQTIISNSATSPRSHKPLFQLGLTRLLVLAVYWFRSDPELNYMAC